MGEPDITVVSAVGPFRNLPETVEEPQWARAARCRTADPALFFGPNRFEPKRERFERESQAIAICRTCPCIAECRDHAIAAGEAYGVWGGLGEAERRELIDDVGFTRAG